jgi:hypothetical protein
LAEQQSITICIRYLPPDGRDINAFNLQLRDELRMFGQIVVNGGYIGNVLAVRFVAANADTIATNIIAFFENLFGVADALLGNRARASA